MFQDTGWRGQGLAGIAWGAGSVFSGTARSTDSESFRLCSPGMADSSEVAFLSGPSDLLGFVLPGLGSTSFLGLPQPLEELV